MGNPFERPTSDTICAIATPPGIGGIGIIRLSGPAAPALATELSGNLPAPRHAALRQFFDQSGCLIDTGLLLYFPAPNSFTGEDVVELQVHGGPVILQLLLQRLLALGARSARPGEFSERAFLNGKLDLAQAEAIADLVASSTEAAARAAQQSLTGAFSLRVNQLQESLTRLRVHVEAAIDFTDEEIDFLADDAVRQQLESAQRQLRRLLREARRGRLLRDGFVLAIVGRPNAGKSSLLNALTGQDSAIVTEIPGTTRDLLREWISLDGIPVQAIDTAGLRETDDAIEAEGVRRARQALANADLALLVVDLTTPIDAQLALLDELQDPKRTIIAFNKCDLRPTDEASTHPAATGIPSESVSALTGQGLDELKIRIRDLVGHSEQSEGGFSARQRHIDALTRAEQHLASAEHRLINDRAAELVAEELRLAQRDLGELTGEFLPDDLLGAIFSTFCIGK